MRIVDDANVNGISHANWNLSTGEDLSQATTVAQVRVRPFHGDPPDSTIVEKGAGLSFSTVVEESTAVE